MATLGLKKAPVEFVYQVGMAYRSTRYGQNKVVYLISMKRTRVTVADTPDGNSGQQSMSKEKFERLFNPVG